MAQALIRPTGEAAVAAVGAGKARGRSLTPPEVRRLRDLLLVVLVRVLRLSVPDAERVMNAGVCRGHIYRRLEQCPADAPALLRAMAAGGRLR